MSCSGLRKQIDATSGPLVPAGDLLETRRTTASDGHTPVVLHSQLSAGPMGRSGQVLARAGPWARHVQHQPIRPVGHVPRAVLPPDHRTLDRSQIVHQPLCENRRMAKTVGWLSGRFGMQRTTGDVHKQQRSAAHSGGGGLGTAGTPSANRYEIAFKQGGASGK